MKVLIDEYRIICAKCKKVLRRRAVEFKSNQKLPHEQGKKATNDSIIKIRAENKKTIRQAKEEIKKLEGYKSDFMKIENGKVIVRCPDCGATEYIRQDFPLYEGEIENKATWEHY